VDLAAMVAVFMVASAASMAADFMVFTAGAGSDSVRD
jgi:hypothetical protein